MQKPFDAQDILAVGWRLVMKSFLLEDVYSVVWITVLYLVDGVECIIKSLSLQLSSRCLLLEQLSTAQPTFYCDFCMVRKPKALCRAGKLHIRIITNPQVLCKRWGTSSSQHWSDFTSFVKKCFRCSCFLTYFPPWMPAPQNSSLTHSQGYVKTAIFSLNHKNASYWMCPFLLK